jgi:hypothetical protein
MAVFPSLNPSGTRTYTAGDYPHTVYTGLSGDQSRVRHSAVLTGSTVNLSFGGLSEADMLSILSHYQGQLGNYYAFTLPSIAFAGMVDAAVFTLSRYQWRYQAPPVVNDLPCGTHTVDVQLISVAPEPVATAGARLVVVASIGLTPVVSTSGLTATVTASIEYGAGTAAGLAEAITITLAAGTPSGDTQASGAFLNVLFDLAPGAAFGANGLTQTVTASLAGGSATGTSVDPNFANVSLLLHMDGSNGSTTFTDSSSAARTITQSGNAQISTVQSKFGGSSGVFDGTGDYLSVADTNALDMGTGDFSIEFWFYWNASQTVSFPRLLSKGVYATAGTLEICINPANGNVFALYGSNATAIGFGGATTSNTWHNFVMTRSGTTLRGFVNGIQGGSSPYTVSENFNNATALRIGSSQNNEAFNGYIDELRITKGVARYTANFTPPTAAFPNS